MHRVEEAIDGYNPPRPLQLPYSELCDFKIRNEYVATEALGPLYIFADMVLWLSFLAEKIIREVRGLLPSSKTVLAERLYEAGGRVKEFLSQPWRRTIAYANIEAMLRGLNLPNLRLPVFRVPYRLGHAAVQQAKAVLDIVGRRIRGAEVGRHLMSAWVYRVLGR